MARVLCYMQHMARGQSGRVVLEIDPAVKRALHARLASEGRTLKDWFLERAQDYLNPRQYALNDQAPPTLLRVAEPKAPYSTTKSSG
jgi:hypothetical protein